MLAMQFFGPGRSILAAAIIAIPTYMAWNHPYAIITMTAEVAVVGWLIRRRKRSLLIADTLYWLFVGIPLGYLCFHFIAHLPTSNSIFLMTKQAINGIANALVARLICTGYALWLHSSPRPIKGIRAFMKLFSGQKPQESASIFRISFREILANLLAFFVICTALILLAVASRADFAEIDHRIRSSLIQESRRVAESLENWLENRRLPVVNLARLAETLSPSQMQPRLEQHRTSDSNFQRIVLLNKESVSTAYSPPVDELGRNTIGWSYADRPFIPTLKRTLQPMLSEVVLSKVGRPAPIAIMIAPVLTRGEYNGCVSGILNFNRILDILQTNIDGTNLLYSLLDKNGNVIVSNRKDQKILTPFSRSNGTMSRPEAGLSQWVPVLPTHTSVIESWGKSLYVAESAIGSMAEWKLVLEQPVAPFQKMLYDTYTGRLTLVFILLVVALAIAEMVSRQVAVTNEQLSDLTHDLPVKLASGATIAWPESGIRDSSNLIANFREMADALSARFTESRNLNESLEQRVEERTQALRASEEKFKAMVETIPLAIHLTVGIEQRTQYVNPTMVQLFGYTQEDIPSVEQWWPLAYPDEEYRRKISAEWNRRVEHAIETQSSIEPMEVVVTCKDGSKKNISWGYVTMGDKNYSYGLDLTARTQAEEKIRQLNADLEQRVIERTAQLEAANKDLEAFTYTVSHDLRAPLRHIDGYVELLVSRCRDGLTEKGLHYVETIADSARQMGVLIDDLLQFSRTGRTEMRRERLDMTQALREARTLLEKSHAGRTIDWVIDELPAVRGDAALLRQVWVNLLENAVKFTRTRKNARIEVSAREGTGERIFVVKDNGVGFDMQYAGKLFGVFQRLHSLDDFEGTGIGLATVQRILTRHGGRIWAEAAPNRGASFFFTLPA